MIAVQAECCSLRKRLLNGHNLLETKIRVILFRGSRSDRNSIARRGKPKLADQRLSLFRNKEFSKNCWSSSLSSHFLDALCFSSGWPRWNFSYSPNHYRLYSILSFQQRSSVPTTILESRISLVFRDRGTLDPRPSMEGIRWKNELYKVVEGKNKPKERKIRKQWSFLGWRGSLVSGFMFSLDFHWFLLVT